MEFKLSGYYRSQWLPFSRNTSLKIQERIKDTHSGHCIETRCKMFLRCLLDRKCVGYLRQSHLAQAGLVSWILLYASYTWSGIKFWWVLDSKLHTALSLALGGNKLWLPHLCFYQKYFIGTYSQAVFTSYCLWFVLDSKNSLCNNIWSPKFNLFSVPSQKI